MGGGRARLPSPAGPDGLAQPDGLPRLPRPADAMGCDQTAGRPRRAGHRRGGRIRHGARGAEGPRGGGLPCRPGGGRKVSGKLTPDGREPVVGGSASAGAGKEGDFGFRISDFGFAPDWVRWNPQSEIRNPKCAPGDAGRSRGDPRRRRGHVPFHWPPCGGPDRPLRRHPDPLQRRRAGDGRHRHGASSPSTATRPGPCYKGRA
jgi:hypothetical protein